MDEISPVPTEPTPPGGYMVLAVAAALLFIVLGAVGLTVRFFADDPLPETASQLTGYSLTSIGLGLAIGVGCWLVQRLCP